MKAGASAHRAQYTTAIWQSYRMSNLQWPPFSSNFNPIENLWRILKNRLNKCSPQSTGLPSMATTIQDEWYNNTSHDFLRYDTLILCLIRLLHLLHLLMGIHVGKTSALSPLFSFSPIPITLFVTLFSYMFLYLFYLYFYLY